MQEVERVTGYFDEKLEEGCKEINSTNIIDVSVGSIINTMLFGYRFIGVSILRLETSIKLEEFINVAIT